MDFIRKRKRSMDARVERYWFSECGQYRITWRSQVFGVKVAPRYHACVRVVERDGFEWWNFAGRRSPYKKFETAVEAAKTHRKVWEYALKLAAGERKGRADRLRALEIKSRVGTGISRNMPLFTLPVWVANTDDTYALHNLKTTLFPEGKRKADDECDLLQDGSEPSRSDYTGPSIICESEQSGAPSSSNRIQTNGPALAAKGAEQSTIPATPDVRLRGTKCGPASSVPTAEVASACLSKTSKWSIPKPSKSTRKKRQSTKRSSQPGKPRSKNSQNKSAKQ